MISEGVSAIQSAVFHEDRSVMISVVFVYMVDDRVRKALKTFASMIASNKIAVGPFYFARLNLASQHGKWPNRAKIARTVEFRLTSRFNHETDLAPFVNAIAPGIEKIEALLGREVPVTA